MKCPQCVTEGKRSVVYPGMRWTTLMASAPYYDEAGNYVANDPNTTTTHYSCSEGHEWMTSTCRGVTTVRTSANTTPEVPT